MWQTTSPTLAHSVRYMASNLNAIEPGCRISDGDFAHADLSHRVITDCEFQQCDFRGSNFRASELTGSRFVRCRFNSEDAQTPADFSQSELRETTFRHCELSIVSFTRARAYGVAFEHCQLQGSDLSRIDCRLPIGASDLAEFAMSNCNFSFGNLSQVYLAGCSLTDNKMIDCCLDHCDLSGADLSGNNLHNASVIQTVLVKADLRGSTFNTIDPARLDLTGVQLYLSQMQDLVAPLGIVLQADP